MEKIAKVTPVFKGGKRTESDNYRPISVLPQLCLEYSRVIHEFGVTSLCQAKGLIQQRQFAYVRHSPTTTALIKTVGSWKLAINKGEKVACAFLDSRKAFDVIDHVTLLNKLQAHGVSGTILEWMNSYLSERTQLVSCGGTTSSKKAISHRVPKGSILGPALFNVHINGIRSACQNCNFALYADDTEVHASSMNIDTAEDIVNSDPRSISSWFNRSGLVCNTKKSEVMLIGTNHAVRAARELKVIPDEKPLKQSEHFKYQGLHIDNRLSWNFRIAQISFKIYPKLKMHNKTSSYYFIKNI